MKFLYFISLAILVLTSSQAQTKSQLKSLEVSDLKFRSTFGFHPIDSTNVFSLLGSEFFRTPRSENSDSLIKAWIDAHPKAKVIPVTSLGPTMIADRNSKMTYCWVIDKEDTLNNYLIKNGCFPGGTMQRPQTWKEMTKAEKKMYEEEKPQITVYIDKKIYEEFLEQVKSAEIFARKNELGIWKKDQE
jgi:hypothetical protein